MYAMSRVLRPLRASPDTASAVSLAASASSLRTASRRRFASTAFEIRRGSRFIVGTRTKDSSSEVSNHAASASRALASALLKVRPWVYTPIGSLSGEESTSTSHWPLSSGVYRTLKVRGLVIVSSILDLDRARAVVRAIGAGQFRGSGRHAPGRPLGSHHSERRHASRVDAIRRNRVDAAFEAAPSRS